MNSFDIFVLAGFVLSLITAFVEIKKFIKIKKEMEEKSNV